MQELITGPTFEANLEKSKGATKQSKNDRSIAELLSNIETLLKFGEQELAKALLSRALLMDSHNTTALRKLTNLFKTKTSDSLRLKVQEEICKAENNFQTVAELGHLYFTSNMDRKALSTYYNALNAVMYETQEQYEVFKNIGIILTRDGDFDGAEEYFNKAFGLRPNCDQLTVNLGTLAIQQQNYNLALERFRKAVELNPNNDKAWVGLVLVHNQMGDLDLAFANIERAVEINPYNRTAVHVYSNWANSNGKIQPAIEKISEYLSSVEIDEEMSFVLVHLFCQMNQFALAELEIERVLLWNPDSPQALQLESELRKITRKS